MTGKKMAVAGSRSGSLSLSDCLFLSDIVKSRGVSEIVTGGAKGIDSAAHGWAIAKGLKTRQFFADWDGEGKRAGPMRNRKMAEYADLVVLFPGGIGTSSMRNEAVKAGVEVIEASTDLSEAYQERYAIALGDGDDHESAREVAEETVRRLRNG